jgi:hypothetical protein
MKLSMKTNLALMGLTMAPAVLALPTIYPTDLTNLKNVLNTTNSNIVADTVDKNVFYVLPPNTGTSEVTGLHTITANVGFCKEMSQLQGYSRSSSERISRLEEQEFQAMTELNAIQKRLVAAREDAAEYVTQNNLTELDYLDNRITQLEGNIAELNDKLYSCEDIRCQEFLDQLSRDKDEKYKLTTRRQILARQHTRAMGLYVRKQQAVKNIQLEYQEASEAWTNLANKIRSIQDEYIKLYTKFSSMEGAQASIAFDSIWDDNVKTLADKNKGIAFKKIETRDSVIMTSVADIKDLPSTGSIMGFNMGGKFSEGALRLPAYPQDMVGNIRLSLLGVCPMLHPQDYNIPVENGATKMKFGLTASYEYPSAFVAKAKATYNMHKLYQKIVKTGKKGGFFSSKSFTSVTERTFFKDEFKVDWSEQDASVAFSEEEKAELEQGWRHQIFTRMAAIGLPAQSNPGAMVSAEVPKTGAAVLGQSLANNKACRLNKYCAAATIGINVLDAIFGSSKSTASYTNIQDVDMTESMSRESVTYKPYITSYK